MSDSVSSVQAVPARPLMYEIPPVTPIVGKAIPPSGSASEPARAATAAGVGQKLDIFV
jgi:hypothetical protein